MFPRGKLEHQFSRSPYISRSVPTIFSARGCLQHDNKYIALALQVSRRMPWRSQFAQLLRKRRLANAKVVFEFPHRAFAFKQQVYDGKTIRFARDLSRLLASPTLRQIPVRF